MLQRNSKLVILGSLDISGQTNLKWWYQFAETYEVYLQEKIQIHATHFAWDIAKVL